MRSQAHCKFRNINVEYDQRPAPEREMGNAGAVDAGRPIWENCSEYDSSICGRHDCLLAPDSGLGAGYPFEKPR